MTGGTTIGGRSHCYLGEMSEAMKWLNMAYEKKEAQLVFLGVDPLWDPIRDDPRFQDLLRRMNFPKQ